MIRGREIYKSFTEGGRPVEVLRGASIEVSAGTMCAVMGPSGSGKSTLLYCLAGLEPVDRGEVWFGDRDLTTASRAALARLRRDELGFLFQSYNLIPSLSAFDNVALPFRLAGKRPPRERIKRLLDEVGLAHRRDQFPATLSGGEQQRVALARVVVTSPAAVFADEPTGALDTAAERAVLDLLGDIGAAPDRAVLMATHDPVVAARCDRVVFLQDGRLVADLAAPTSEQVSGQLEVLRQREGDR